MEGPTVLLRTRLNHLVYSWCVLLSTVCLNEEQIFQYFIIIVMITKISIVAMAKCKTCCMRFDWWPFGFWIVEWFQTALGSVENPDLQILPGECRCLNFGFRLGSFNWTLCTAVVFAFFTLRMVSAESTICLWWRRPIHFNLHCRFGVQREIEVGREREREREYRTECVYVCVHTVRRLYANILDKEIQNGLYCNARTSGHPNWKLCILIMWCLKHSFNDIISHWGWPEPFFPCLLLPSPLTTLFIHSFLFRCFRRATARIPQSTCTSLKWKTFQVAIRTLTQFEY